MLNHYSFNTLINELAEVVAEKVLQRLNEDPGARARNEHRLLSVAEVATRLGRSEQAVYHLIGQGRLRTVRMDRRVFVDSRDLDEFIQASKIN